MALFTTTDRDNVVAALVQATIDGFASVTVGGQTITRVPLADIEKILARINADLASDKDKFGLRMIKLIPPEAG